MTELQPKLKLKRKKSSAEPELPWSRKERRVIPDTERDGPLTAAAAAAGSEPVSVGSAADALWALTLGWLLKKLPSGPVAELPPPSAVITPTCSAAEDWKLPDEVPPFPEYSSLHLCPDPLDDSETSQDTPLSPPTRLSPPTHLSPPTLLSSQTAPIDSQGPKAVLPQVTQGTSGGTETMKRTERTERTEAAGETSRAGALMPSCPMCLLLFPLGFTQMDRDGHLARCLSEVNIDVTW